MELGLETWCGNAAISENLTTPSSASRVYLRERMPKPLSVKSSSAPMACAAAMLSDLHPLSCTHPPRTRLALVLNAVCLCQLPVSVCWPGDLCAKGCL